MVSGSANSFIAWTFLFVSLLHFGNLCFVEHHDMSTQEFLEKSDIIVFGRDMQHVERFDDTMTSIKMNVTDCEFHVYCILKSGNASMKERITIEHIAPKSSCSAYYEGIFMEGKEMIVSLTPASSSNFILHEVNMMQEAVFDPTHELFEIVANISDSSSWKTPSNSKIDMCKMARNRLVVSGNEYVYDYDYDAYKEPEPFVSEKPEPPVTRQSPFVLSKAPNVTNSSSEPEVTKEREPLVTKSPEPEVTREPEHVATRPAAPGPGVQETEQDNGGDNVQGGSSHSLPNVGASTDNDPENTGVSLEVNMLMVLLTVYSSMYLLLQN